jgi:glycosyltransferase involved in cell wall biosynthesis
MLFLRKIAGYLQFRSDVALESSAGQPEVSDPLPADGHGKNFNATIDAEIETIRKSGLFDEPFYRSMYPGLQPPPSDAIRHYCEYGWREGKDPSVDFDTRFYLATYSDIRNAGINPFWHYVVAGASELRHAVPDLDTRYENDIRFGVVETDIRLLAFYSSPDWTELRGGRSDSRGQRQAPLPHEELGFYDPLDWRKLMDQARTAKRHGIYGFCFQLGTSMDGAATTHPVDLFLAHDDIDFRFCVQAGLSSENIPESLIVAIARAVSDRRFIHLRGRPVILVTLPGEKQRATAAFNYLKRQLAQQGIDNPFLIGRLAPANECRSCVSLADLADLCDAALDLPGNPVPGETGGFLPMDKNGVDEVPYTVIVSQGVARAQAAQSSGQPLFHCVTLGRDNTATTAVRPLVYTRFHIKHYRQWLDAAISGARATHLEDRRFVFLNGWNNWNEGLFLEADRQGGFGRVNETTRALLRIASGISMPKISVIVPNYNHERFLRRRLNSIYGQTYKNIEVILLDDCSSDRSRTVLDQYKAAYPEITHTLYNDKNSGSTFRQWAKGIKAATGDLIWVAESDDFCDEQFLEVLVRCFDDEAVMLAYSKCVFVDKDEVPMRDEFKIHLSDLECAEKWNSSYVATAHNEVRCALGIKNTIPNASGVLFKRPIDMPLLDDELWLSMVVAGDWVFYLQLIRGGKIAYSTETTNFFRRHEDNATEATYKKEVFYREIGMASQTVAALYSVPLAVFEQCQESFKKLYIYHLGRNDKEFSLWYNYESVLRAREKRLPNVMVTTMGFYPGGAEILPIRLANEFKRQGCSVLLLSAGFNRREEGVRRMLRNDIPLVETSDIDHVKAIIHDFGVEVLNTHQWHIQKYPMQVPDVFDQLQAHVASLHGMIEHGNAFDVTEEELRKADQSITTWVYTAEKNLVPFSKFGLYDKSSSRFVKIPNGMQPPSIVPIPRADMGIPENAFVLCCVSRAIPDKGWAETILVVERARALSGRDIRLILVGNGTVYDDYCRIGVPDFVYLAGFSANSVGHYASADMGIMLTTFKSESFPLTIVDCLFAGKPYIASDVGDIRNMLTISKDVAGEVIELVDWEVPIEGAAEVVASFATDKEKYVNALALVQGVANRYHIDIVASQYIHLFAGDRHKIGLTLAGT